MPRGRPKPQAQRPATQGTPNALKVMGEMGRDRNAKHVTTKGMREVIIYKGPRDNFEETSQIYLDEDGPIGGKIVRETANRVIVEYPEKNFKANQLKAEELAMRRVSQAAPVSDGAVTRNVVAKKEAASLDQLFADAEANATENMQREKADERILAAAEVAFDG